MLPAKYCYLRSCGKSDGFGTVTFLTIATDDIAVDRVEFYHNYELEFTATSYPFSYDWNSTLADEDTEHIWHVKAFDTSGNEHKLNQWYLLSLIT